MSTRKVLVGLSGGPDSGITAALLQNQGYDVAGFHLKLWDPDRVDLGACFKQRACSVYAEKEAQKICKRLEIPYFSADAHEAFMDQVVDQLVHETLQYRTPNPCASCTRGIKFEWLVKKADELGYDWVATGHYAQIERDANTGQARVYRAADDERDQTYFLFGLSQETIGRTLLPLGQLPRTMTTRLIEEFGMSGVARADTRTLCFVDEPGLRDYMASTVPASLRLPGMVRTTDGRVVGEHDGLELHSIGKARGVQYVAGDSKYFVVGYDSVHQALVVGPESELLQSVVVARRANWVRPLDRLRGLKCLAAYDAKKPPVGCRVTFFENETVHVDFDEAQRALSPGQALAFYLEDELLGGAYVDEVGASW